MDCNTVNWHSHQASFGEPLALPQHAEFPQSAQQDPRFLCRMKAWDWRAWKAAGPGVGMALRTCVQHPHGGWRRASGHKACCKLWIVDVLGRGLFVSLHVLSRRCGGDSRYNIIYARYRLHEGCIQRGPTVVCPVSRDISLAHCCLHPSSFAFDLFTFAPSFISSLVRCTVGPTELWSVGYGNKSACYPEYWMCHNFSREVLTHIFCFIDKLVRSRRKNAAVRLLCELKCKIWAANDSRGVQVGREAAQAPPILRDRLGKGGWASTLVEELILLRGK
jgi:hypothetical protein